MPMPDPSRESHPLYRQQWADQGDMPDPPGFRVAIDGEWTARRCVHPPHWTREVHGDHTWLHGRHNDRRQR
jgi:hypothetical protein